MSGKRFNWNTNFHNVLSHSLCSRRKIVVLNFLFSRKDFEHTHGITVSFGKLSFPLFFKPIIFSSVNQDVCACQVYKNQHYYKSLRSTDIIKFPYLRDTSQIGEKNKCWSQEIMAFFNNTVSYNVLKGEETLIYCVKTVDKQRWIRRH